MWLLTHCPQWCIFHGLGWKIQHRTTEFSPPSISPSMPPHLLPSCAATTGLCLRPRPPTNIPSVPPGGMLVFSQLGRSTWIPFSQSGGEDLEGEMKETKECALLCSAKSRTNTGGERLALVREGGQNGSVRVGRLGLIEFRSGLEVELGSDDGALVRVALDSNIVCCCFCPGYPRLAGAGSTAGSVPLCSCLPLALCP